MRREIQPEWACPHFRAGYAARAMADGPFYQCLGAYAERGVRCMLPAGVREAREKGFEAGWLFHAEKEARK